MENIPHIYYINLAQSVKRNNEIIAEFNRYGIKKYKRFNGINGHDKECLKYVEYNCDVPPGVLGCTLSHLYAIKQAYDDGLDDAIIMEDDAKLEFLYNNINRFNTMISSLDKHIDVVQCYTFRTYYDIINRDIEYIDWNYTHFSTLMYYIKRSGMSKLLRFYNGEKFILPPGVALVADMFIYQYNNTVTTIFPYAYSNEDDSTIHTDNLHTHNIRKNKMIEIVATRNVNTFNFFDLYFLFDKDKENIDTFLTLTSNDIAIDKVTYLSYRHELLRKNINIDRAYSLIKRKFKLSQDDIDLIKNNEITYLKKNLYGTLSLTKLRDGDKIKIHEYFDNEFYKKILDKNVNIKYESYSSPEHPYLILFSHNDRTQEEKFMYDNGYIQIANIMRLCRYKNIYIDMQKKELWDEQIQKNLPVLLLSSFLLNDYFKKKGYNKILFTTRSSIFLSQIFRILYGDIYQIDEFNISRYMCYKKTNNEEYCDYVKGICTEGSIIVDIFGSGNSSTHFFQKVLGKVHPKIFVSIIAQSEYHDSIFESCDDIIERLNYYQCGTMVDYVGGLALRHDFENEGSLFNSIIEVRNVILNYLDSNLYDITTHYDINYDICNKHLKTFFNDYVIGKTVVDKYLVHYPEYDPHDKLILEKIAIKHTTLLSRDIYATYRYYYTTLFQKIKHNVKNILLVGFSYNFEINRLRTWKDYFGTAVIYGADNFDMRFTERDGLIDTIQCDQSKYPDLLNLSNRLPPEVDIIIDDGTKISGNQQMTLGILFPKLKKGGIYIIQNLHRPPINDKYIDTATFLKSIHNINLENVNMDFIQHKYLVDNIKDIYVLPLSGSEKLDSMAVIYKQS